MSYTREIRLEKITNLRELGGLVTGEGKVIKKGTLLRAPNIASASFNDLKTLLYDCKLKTIIDLRTPQEVAGCFDVMAENVQYLNMPVFIDYIQGIAHTSCFNFTKEIIFF